MWVFFVKLSCWYMDFLGIKEYGWWYNFRVLGWVNIFVCRICEGGLFKKKKIMFIWRGCVFCVVVLYFIVESFW